MRRIILMLGLAWSLSFPVAAHQCVLEGSTSEAIQSYNCLLYTSPSPRDS